jgi:peptide/nickel transport system permease protein
VFRYLIARLLSLIPTLVGVSLLVFLLVRLIPGTIVEQMLGAEAQVTEELLARLRAFFGLDQPIQVQYAHWLAQAVRGNLGVSWQVGMPVLQMILARLQVTAELTLGAMLVALLVGIPFGIISAIKENTALDHVIRIASLFSLSMPIFWQAAMMILMLSVWFRWAPVGYVDLAADPAANVRQMILPWIVLGTAVAATLMRMTRSCLLEVMRQDYIRTARAKGLRERVVIWSHALKNAMIPVITVAGVQVGYLLGGAVVTEEVFTLPGIGRLVLWAIYQRDYPLVQGTVLFIAVAFALTNLAVDAIYGYLDPRIRYTRRGPVTGG